MIHESCATPLYGELDWITLKALEKDRNRRYESPNALAEDIERYLDDKAVQACPPSVYYRSCKFARQNRSWLMTGTALLLVFVAAVIVSATYAIDAHEARQVAQTELRSAQRHLAAATAAREVAANALRAQDAAMRRAKQNQDFALAAVDDLYLELGTRWIANDTVPTRLQRTFLSRAHAIYLAIAQQPNRTHEEQVHAAQALERAARVDHFLQSDVEAERRISLSIERGESLIDEAPRSAERRVELVRRYGLRAELHAEQGDIAAAQKDIRAGLAHLSQLIALAPDSFGYLVDRAQFAQCRATLMMQIGQVQHAETELRKVNQYLNVLPPDKSRSMDHLMAALKNRLLLAQALRIRGQLDMANEDSFKTLNECRNLKNNGTSDERQVTNLEVNALELMADIASARGELQQSADHYLEALSLRRLSLNSRKAPNVFMVPGPHLYDDANWEYGPFCRYIETDLKLADVLRRMGRPYAAEYRLHQSMKAMFVIRSGQPTLRHNVVEANAWALIWQLLREQRPSEAVAAREYAVLVWRETLG